MQFFETIAKYLVSITSFSFWITSSFYTQPTYSQVLNKGFTTSELSQNVDALPRNQVDQIVRIGAASSSGKTLSLDRGYDDMVKDGDYGYLFGQFLIPLKEGKGKRKVFKPVARLKAIKVYSNSSLWVVFEAYHPASLRPGRQNKTPLLLLSESAMLNGRRELEINRKVIIDHPKNIRGTLKANLKDNGDELVEKQGYHGGEDLHDGTVAQEEADITLLDIEQWKDEGFPGEVDNVGFYKSPHAKDFSERIRIQRFEKMSAMFMKKYNDPNFTMRGLYEEQERDPNVSELQSGILGGNYHDGVLMRRKLDQRKKDEVYADLMAKGEAWSADYSDEELSEMLYNIGVLREKDRRREIGAEVFDYQLFGSFGFNLLNNENLEDKENTQPAKREFAFGLEWFLFKEIESLKAFSLEGSFRRSQDGFTTGDYNAIGLDYSAAMSLNWYPFRASNSIGKNIVYVGAHFRYGFGSYEIESLEEKGNYQIFSFPGLSAGVKYNFSNGYGARLSASFENITGDRTIKTVDDGELPDRINYLDGKISIGLSRFF